MPLISRTSVESVSFQYLAMACSSLTVGAMPSTMLCPSSAPQFSSRSLINLQRIGIDHDPVLFAGRSDRNALVAHIAHHSRDIASERVAPATAASHVMVDRLASADG